MSSSGSLPMLAILVGAVTGGEAVELTNEIVLVVAVPPGLVVVTVTVSPATKGVDSAESAVPLVIGDPPAVATPPVTEPLT